MPMFMSAFRTCNRVADGSNARVVIVAHAWPAESSVALKSMRRSLPHPRFEAASHRVFRIDPAFLLLNLYLPSFAFASAGTDQTSACSRRLPM